MVQHVFGLWRTWALRLIFFSLSLAVAGTGNAAPQADSTEHPLVLGVLPFISPIALLKRFAPLRDYLSEAANRPILLETARDYPEFVRRTAQRRYDLLITAPHFVPLAIDTQRYQVTATYASRLTAVILAPVDSKVNQLADLAGHKIATPPAQAIVTWIGEDLLREQIGAGASPQYRAYPSHNAAMSAVVAGEVDAAIVSVSVVNDTSLTDSGIRIIGHSKQFPAMGILMASDLDPALRARLTNTLVAMNDNAAGRAVLERISYPGYQRAGSEDFEPLRRYLPRVRSFLEPQT